MKTVYKLSGLLLIMFFMGGILLSCKKKEADPGHLIVKMTDAPADYLKVNVEISGMTVNHATNGWISIPINTGIYNLLDLQNNVAVVLANNVDLPSGKINQMRLLLGTDNSLITLTDTFQLQIPSGTQTGLKLNLNEVVAPNATLEIVLDFDANASVVELGNGSYNLKPVIKVKSVNQF